MCPIKSGRACGKEKKSGEVGRGGRAGKEGDWEACGKEIGRSVGEDVRERKEIGRELTALDACGSFAICHTVAKYIFRYFKIDDPTSY